MKLAHLMTHMRLLHADDPNFLIQCNLQGCKRTFRKFTVYRNHIYAVHDTTEWSEPPLVPTVPDDRDDPPDDRDDSLFRDIGVNIHTYVLIIIVFEPNTCTSILVDVSTVDPVSSEVRDSITESNLKAAAAKWILKHREAHRIPHSVMESVVSGADFLFKTALSEIQHQVLEKIKETAASTDVLASVSSVFKAKTQYTDIFNGWKQLIVKTHSSRVTSVLWYVIVHKIVLMLINAH